jgi:nicotinamidase-related amidase
MNIFNTAIVLIGFQNDYFSENGVLHEVIESSAAKILSNTVFLLDRLQTTGIMLVSTPIYFTPDYSELVNPVGILKVIQEVGAFRKDTIGSETISELTRYGERILTVEGKRGLNAFHSTNLEQELLSRGITDVVLAGVVTSICIDSTARSAFERGFKVHVLSDCTAGRTQYEQDFYCSEVFPLYANVITSQALIESLALS